MDPQKAIMGGAMIIAYDLTFYEFRRKSTVALLFVVNYGNKCLTKHTFSVLCKQLRTTLWN